MAILKEMITPIVSEFIEKYKSEGAVVEVQEIFNRADRNLSAAVANYANLIEPKTSKIDVYAEYWIREELKKDFILKTLKPIKPGKQPEDSYLLPLSKYLHLFPPDKISQIRDEIFASRLLIERQGITQKYQSFFDELKPVFADVVKSRTQMANARGFKNFLDMSLVRDGLSASKLKRFINEINEVIDRCNKEFKDLITESISLYSNTCYICRLSLPNLTIPDQVISKIAIMYPILEKFKDKIKIQYGSKVTTFFNKETDTFIITLYKDANYQHHIINLAHELGHVIYFLVQFHKAKAKQLSSKYLAEKFAHQVEFSFVKQLLRVAYQAELYGALKMIHRCLFEIEIYFRPNQDYDQLYTQIFNRCFPGAKQYPSPLYLLDEQFIMSPLATLPHSIAVVDFIFKEY